MTFADIAFMTNMPGTVVPPNGYSPDDISRLTPDTKDTQDIRNDFQRDRDRIIHSAAFRRLQGKTQVYGLGHSAYYRSRLTHSIEVAQIGRGIADIVKANPDLVEAICLAHDIGHPPFGHAGENKLHTLLTLNEGFNGNAQNLRILTYLEEKYPDPAIPGLNLTKATLDGLIKYPHHIQPRKQGIPKKKGYYESDINIVERIRDVNDTRKTFECQIMNWADDIAYSSHDLEDALAIGVIKAADLEDESMIRTIKAATEASYAVEYPNDTTFEIAYIGQQLDELSKYIKDEQYSARSLAQFKSFLSKHIGECIHGVKELNNDGAATGRYSRDLQVDRYCKMRVELYKQIVFNIVIRSHQVYTLQHAGMQKIEDLFHALTNHMDENLEYLYPPAIRIKVKIAINSRKQIEIIARDFIASMTDMECDNYWRRMFANDGNLFMTRA